MHGRIWLLKLHYTHISRAERGIIQRLQSQKSCAEIARIIGKHRSTVLRELKRNRDAGDLYIESHAQANMLRRRRAAKEAYRIIDNDIQLQMQLERLFKNDHSPEQIVGYMQRAGHIRRLCHQTIYDWVHRKWQSRKEWLRFQGKPRMPYGKRRDAWQAGKRHISERPSIVEKRRRAGDWEGDLVHGSKDDSRHALLTLVDRASGFGIIWKTQSLYPEYVAQVVALALKGLPVHTITFDNGFEFGHHKTVEKKLNCKVFFTDTNSPEQRGTNENFNGLLRRLHDLSPFRTFAASNGLEPRSNMLEHRR